MMIVTRALILRRNYIDNYWIWLWVGKPDVSICVLFECKKKCPTMEIKADVKYAFIEEHNGIELDRVFGIHLQECTLEERKKYSEMPIRNSWLSQKILAIRNIVGIHKRSFYIQSDYTEYFPEVYCLLADQDKYLLGIWANEKYFEDIKEEIQTKVFCFRLPLNESSKVYKHHISSCESVAIHVRRGDYVQYGNHVMGKSYYNRAIKYMEENLQCDIQYFVFSDDMEYAKSLFCDVLNIEYVVGNEGNDSWMDMYLMSLCKHNIIANSSFSFWGAYLNKNRDKIVIASSRPFVRCKCPFACKNWIIMDED